MMRRTGAFVMGLLLLLAGGCREDGDDGISVDATGVVVGLAWLDRNGTGELESSDPMARDVRIQLRAPTGTQVLYSATSNGSGEFTLPGVMVGDYRVSVDSASIGDSLQVLRVDSADATVTAGDTVAVLVALTFPRVTTDSLRVAPLDRSFFVEGRVISEWNTFGDATIHVRDSTGALSAVRVQPSSAALGDSVRLLGDASRQAGRGVLKDAVVFPVETGVESPDPVITTTATAAAADDGALDAELGRVEDAPVQDTLRNSFGELVLRVDDGSGPLEIVLDRDIPFFFDDTDIIGAPIDATGVLVPPASGLEGTWVLKPRRNPDLSVR